MKKEYDYIIVGQGLSGSILSFTLKKLNKNFLVIDQGFDESSSKIAAGIINSLVLKRLTKSWRADEFSEFVPSFYYSLEEFLLTKIYTPTNSYKLISSEEEENYWEHRLNTENLGNYMFEEIQNIENPSINFKRVGIIKKVAVLNVLEFMTTYRNNLKNAKCILEEKFDYNSIEFYDSYVAYKDIHAKKIIFCEGSQAMENPFFNWLPFSLNKGELLTIDAPNLNLSAMLNKSSFVLPKGKNDYIIGATNEWKDLNCKPTNEKKEELYKAFKKISNAEFRLLKHEAGIRPATRDRRPFIGLHPERDQLAIFNGMGAKAALMAPLLAKEFVEYLEKNKPLNKDYAISRYFKLY